MFRFCASAWCGISKEIASKEISLFNLFRSISGKFKHHKKSKNVNFEGTNNAISILIPNTSIIQPIGGPIIFKLRALARYSIFSCRRSRVDLGVGISVLLLLVVVLEPLPLLSELSLCWTFRLLRDFSIWGTISFWALCPSRNSALWGLIPLGALCPLWLLGSFVNAGSLDWRVFSLVFH